MLNFITYCVLWTLAIYGLVDLIKIGFSNIRCHRIESNGIYVIVAAKNQEHQIEGFLRSVVFRLLYGKEDYVQNVIVTDIDSIDNTKEIMNKISKDYNEIKVLDWNECKKILDNLE